MEKFKPHPVDWAQIERFLASAEKKVASARKILAFDEEASLQQSYEAMLKAAIGFTHSHGFRARSIPGHHIAIIEFVEERVSATHAGLMAVFDQLRRKRNTVLYDDEGFVSREEAEQAIQSARRLIALVRSEVTARKP
jgi:uncharacterized protein (UPF0332 family)